MISPTNHLIALENDVVSNTIIQKNISLFDYHIVCSNSLRIYFFKHISYWLNGQPILHAGFEHVNHSNYKCKLFICLFGTKFNHPKQDIPYEKVGKDLSKFIPKEIFWGKIVNCILKYMLRQLSRDNIKTNNFCSKKYFGMNSIIFGTKYFIPKE